MNVLAFNIGVYFWMWWFAALTTPGTFDDEQ